MTEACTTDQQDSPAPDALVDAERERCAEVAMHYATGPKMNGRDYRQAFRIAQAITDGGRDANAS